MESWHSIVLRRRADLAMEWAKPGFEAMAAVYAKMREDCEDIKRLGAWGGLGWGSDQINGPYQYWPALEGYCQGEWVEGLERSLVKEGWGWIDGKAPRWGGQATVASRQSRGYASVKSASLHRRNWTYG